VGDQRTAYGTGTGGGAMEYGTWKKTSVGPAAALSQRQHKAFDWHRGVLLRSYLLPVHCVGVRRETEKARS
jgi:hypothetical protein